MRACLALLGFAALVVPGNAHASSVTTVVKPGSPAGWTAANSGGAAGDFVDGPAAPPLGAGSFRQTVSAQADRQAMSTGAFNGSDLASLTALSYSTYQATSPSGQASAINLRVDTDGDGITDDTLSFEPVYQSGSYPMVTGAGPVPNQCAGVANCAGLGRWQAWDALNGGWWSANAGTIGPPLDTIAHYAATNPGARLATDTNALVVAAGSGWSNFDGNFDGLTVGVTGDEETFDFEATTPVTRVVHPAVMRTWKLANSGSAHTEFTNGIGAPPLGIGSVHQQNTNADDTSTIETTELDGKLLTDIHALSYSTYVGTPGQQPAYIQLLVDLNGNGVYDGASLDDKLLFQPAYQNGSWPMVPGAGAIPNQCGTNSACINAGEWQSWNAAQGGWVSEREHNPGNGPPMDTLGHYALAHPSAKLVAVGNGSVQFNAGSGVVADTYTDGARVNSTVYDFETFDPVVDCDSASDDIAAVQAAVDNTPDGSVLRLRGTCDFTAAAPHGGDVTSIASAAVAIRPAAPFFAGLTITSDGAPQSATVLGSGTQTAFFVAPGNANVTIKGLKLQNFARPLVAINSTNTTFGDSGTSVLPVPEGNRILGTASADSAILAVARNSPATLTVTYGSGGSRSASWPTGEELSGFEASGNTITYSGVGVPDGDAKDIVGIDVRERGGVVQDVLIENNVVGFVATDFPSFNINAVRVFAHTIDTTADIRGVQIRGNQLGALEEFGLSEKPNAGGRAGIVVRGVSDLDVRENAVRVRLSPTGGVMPGGGIVVSDSHGDETTPSSISDNEVTVQDDSNSAASNLGAIGVIDNILKLFGTTNPGPETGFVHVDDNTIAGSSVRAIVLNGVRRADVKGTSTAAGTLGIGLAVTGPGSVDNPGPVTLAGAVRESAVCGNTLSGVPDDATRVEFNSASGSTANSFPGGAAFTGNGGCVARGVTLVPTGGTTHVSEAGATDTYTVALTYRPSGDVTVTPVPGAQLTTSPTGMTFGPGTWSTPQTVTVSAVDDAVVQGSRVADIAHTVASVDAGYDGIDVPSLEATITDDDNGSVLVVESGGATSVAEGGATDTYTIALAAPPAGTVTITPEPGDGITVSPSSVSFTAADWSVAQTITVTANNDTVRQGSRAVMITHSSSDPLFAPVGSVVAQVADDENPAPPVIAIPTQNQLIPSTTVVVSGTAEPGATVTVVEGATTIGAVTAPGGAWSLSHAFTTGTHHIAAKQTATDSNTSGLSPSRTFTIDDTPPQAPTINSPAEGASVHTLNVTVSGTAEPGADVAIFGGTSGAVARADVGGAWSARLAVSPGAQTIYAFAIDAAGNVGPSSTDRHFTVAIVVPTITAPAQDSYHDSSVTITGKAGTDAVRVDVIEDGIVLGTVPVDTGSWSLTRTLPSGVHTVHAVATNAAHEVTPPSQNRSFFVDAKPPTVAISAPLGVDGIGILLPGQIIQGTARDDALYDSHVKRIKVTYTDLVLGTKTSRGTATCTACPGARVTWSDDTIAELPPGVYSVEVIAFDVLGNQSATATFTVVHIV